MHCGSEIMFLYKSVPEGVTQVPEQMLSDIVAAAEPNCSCAILILGHSHLNGVEQSLRNVAVLQWDC